LERCAETGCEAAADAGVARSAGENAVGDGFRLRLGGGIVLLISLELICQRRE
jgi:hypothetical protein